MAEADLRLNRFLAKAAGSSRRQADRWLEAGRVSVNGQPVDELGMTVGPSDTVTLDGRELHLPQTYEYLLLNKPEGYLVTADDPQARQTIYQLLPAPWHHLYSVGRLDRNSCGLLLLTNDGELTQRLLHPRYKVSKTYLVRVSGRVSERQLQRMRSGIKLSEGRTQPAQIEVLRQSAQASALKFVLREGKKRQIRRMCQAVGLKVEYLQRQRLGPIQLGALPEGQYRLLAPQELQQLKSELGL